MLQKLVSSHNDGGAGKGTDWSNLAGLMTHFNGSQAAGAEDASAEDVAARCVPQGGGARV